MRIATIDCGTNTVLLLVGDVVAGAAPTLVEDQMEVTLKSIASAMQHLGESFLRMEERQDRMALRQDRFEVSLATLHEKVDGLAATLKSLTKRAND